MSASAGLSSAKNRRSGNEVKFAGQPHLPPPQNTRQAQPKAAGGQQYRPTSGQAPAPGASSATMQSQRPPHPMEILKSHEFRLRDLEATKQEDTTSPDTSANVAALTKRIVGLETQNTALLERTKLITQNDVAVNVLKTRVDELTSVVIKMSKELESVSILVKDYNNNIFLKITEGVEEVTVQDVTVEEVAAQEE